MLEKIRRLKDRLKADPVKPSAIEKIEPTRPMKVSPRQEAYLKKSRKTPKSK